MDQNPTADDGSIALDALTPDPRNARKHTARNLATIEAALREVGAARSVVVDEHGVVLAGNATVAAAASAGIARVRVVDADGSELIAVRRSGLTPEQKRRLTLFDNRAADLAEWDTEVLASLAEDTDLALLWDDAELLDLLASVNDGVGEPLTDPDEVPEVPEDPVTQPGNLWLLGEHRLLCGDATSMGDVARLMAGERSPLMPTDPPYLVNYRGGNHPQSWSNSPSVKDKHWDDYREGDGSAFFAAFLRVALGHALTGNPAVYQFHASARQALVEAAWLECGLLVHQQLIWVKARPVLTHSHYLWQHEPCFYGWPKGKQPTKRPPTTARTVWTTTDAWDTSQPVEEDGATGLHPTQKPVALIRRMVEYHTNPRDIRLRALRGVGHLPGGVRALGAALLRAGAGAGVLRRDYGPVGAADGPDSGTRALRRGGRGRGVSRGKVTQCHGKSQIPGSAPGSGGRWRRC